MLYVINGIDKRIKDKNCPIELKKYRAVFLLEIIALHIKGIKNENSVNHLLCK